MGSSNSTLPPPSQPGSPLQVCLNNVFASNTGGVSYPQDLLYQFLDVKPYNTAYSITPAAVTRPTTAEDVAAIVQCAAASSVKVQARSGGHSYGDYSVGGEDGAVVATIGSGTLLADVTSRLHDAGGRAIAHGTCPQVGIGGHATIGGLGPISRQWGLALDHILEVEIILANGTITRANATYNPDILFAAKGAAASFGIVTEFVFLTHPEPTDAVVYSYKIQLGKHADLAPTFAAWQDIVADPNLDRKLASEVIIFELGMIISGTYFGTQDEYNALNFEGRLAQNATVTVSVLDDWLGIVGNWAETEALQIVGGISGPFYSKSLTFQATTLIPMTGIQDLFSYFDTADKGTLIWFAIFDVEGGAVNDVPQNATAYGHRDAQFYMQTYAVGIGSLSNTTTAFVTNMSDIVMSSMPGVQFGAYVGYVDPKLTDGPQEYWGTNLPRLESIKAAIDPGDLFHNPQSVSPVAAAAANVSGAQPSATSSGASTASIGGIRRVGVVWEYWLLGMLAVLGASLQ
ncbi:Reticuline oxidase [Mycena sanguinolenta]|uniref:Reticuline oxidase n=1 Tax=Mycena sanguinolenta TaxID=230812 RepID=A0A8H6Z577_9AGAR|nr:Reticuline oxidase [Mycena sanguinolenta]